MIQEVKDALATAPWWVNSATMRGLAIVGVGLVGRVTGHHFGQPAVENVFDVLTLAGIVYSAHGRVKKERAAALAVGKAAYTGEIPQDVVKQLMKP